MDIEVGEREIVFSSVGWIGVGEMEIGLFACWQEAEEGMIEPYLIDSLMGSDFVLEFVGDNLKHYS